VTGFVGAVLAGCATLPDPIGSVPLEGLVWIGDNIEDFAALIPSAPGALSQFGTHYFAQPNPMYGSWQNVSAQ
jgi:hypothetical protein